MPYVPVDPSLILIPGNRVVLTKDIILNYGTFTLGTAMTCVSVDPVWGYTFVDEFGNQIPNSNKFGRFWDLIAPN